jgi:hypothetical protein
LIHVTIQQLSSFLDEQLAGSSTDLVKQHLAECPECDAKLGALSRMDAALTRALSHDPEESVYRRLEREISAALGPDAMEEALEILAATPDRAAGPHPPKRSAPAQVAAGANAPKATAKVPTTTRPSASRTATASPAPSRPPVAREVPSTAWTPSATRATATAAGSGRAKGSSSGPWIAVLSLAIIAGSAGVVVSHTGTVQGWLDALVGSPNFKVSSPGAASETPVAAEPASSDSAAATSEFTSAEGIGDAAAEVPGASPTASPAPQTPARGLAVTGDDPSDEWDEEALAEEDSRPQTMRADEVLASTGAPGSGRTHGGSRRDDPYSNLRPEAQAEVREAERVHQQTLFHPTAEQFDIAALRWERALEGMSGPEQVTVRGRLADARFRAWEAGPTPERADAATGAIRSYLLFAPPGIAREEAKARLEQIAPR